MLDTARCHRCNKDLSTVEEIHASEGMLFCCEDCAVSHYMDETSVNDKETAKEKYNKYAEVIAPEDIGLA